MLLRTFVNLILEMPQRQLCAYDLFDHAVDKSHRCIARHVVCSDKMLASSIKSEIGSCALQQSPKPSQESHNGVRLPIMQICLHNR